MTDRIYNASTKDIQKLQQQIDQLTTKYDKLQEILQPLLEVATRINKNIDSIIAENDRLRKQIPNLEQD